MMDKRDETPIRHLTERLFGGLRMSWTAVVLFAAAAAVVTAIFLILPVFEDSSFELMGVQYEAWIFFAVIIMSNCQTPLESALKTFVFFLISQPLIYLLQVPFSWLGWGLFRYYRFWFIMTLLTLPGAFVGWFIKKRNWLSVLILSPVLLYLGGIGVSAFRHCLGHFPRLLVTGLFCLGQILLYAAAFCPGKKKWAAFAIPVLAAAVVLWTSRGLDVSATLFLPDDPVLTETAVVIQEDDADPRVTIECSGEDSMVRVQAGHYGTADFRIQDGEREYLYTAEVYEDDAGHVQIKITEK